MYGRILDEKCFDASAAAETVSLGLPSHIRMDVRNDLRSSVGRMSVELIRIPPGPSQ